MILPPFKDLDVYSAINKEAGKQEGDLPQRFYMTLEQEELADWKLKVGDVILPAHSHPLCLTSPVYLGMAAGGTGTVLQDGHIPLEGCSLGDTLAFLRFMYRLNSLNLHNVGFLLKSGHLHGVLRLAHKLDWEFLEMLITLTIEALEEDTPGTESLIKHIFDAGTDLNIDKLQKACRKAVFRLCKTTTFNFSQRAMIRGAVKMTTIFEDSPELLKEALFTLATHWNLEGETYKEAKDYFLPPPALVTWTVPSSSFKADQAVSSNWFKWNGNLEFRLLFKRNYYCSVRLEQKEPPEVAGPPMTFTLLLENWCNPEKSHRAKGTYAFCRNAAAKEVSQFHSDKIDDWKDPAGNLTLRLVELTISDA